MNYLLNLSIYLSLLVIQFCFVFVYSHALHEKSIAQALELHEEQIQLAQRQHIEDIKQGREFHEKETELTKRLHDQVTFFYFLFCDRKKKNRSIFYFLQEHCTRNRFAYR